MTELIIDKGIIIDDVESVLVGIRDFCGRDISDLGVVKKFINQEKNTRFYLDSNLNSSMQQQSNCVYIWADTGFTDYKGSPIFVSLLKKYDEFVGHVVGTIRSLSENARRFFKLNRSMTDKKMAAFRKKYTTKADERKYRHIDDERRYLIESMDNTDGTTEFAKKLLSAGIIGNVDDENTNKSSGGSSPENFQLLETGMTEAEEEITISLLLEKMEDMQKYMDELLHELKKVNSESQAKISELQEKNDEYKRVILQMREFTSCVECASGNERTEGGNIPGHELLGKHGKILVIGGQELGVNVMHGIAKKMGFEKGDFEFVDYDKAKDFTDRIRRNGKYSAVIIGACPHKTTGTVGYNSTVEKLKAIDGMPFTTDARCKSGKLKVTKESFREALLGVCSNLRLKYAC